jgi:hypothetical protein
MHTILMTIVTGVIAIIFVAWFVIEFRGRARRSRITDHRLRWDESKKELDKWLRDDPTRSVYYPEGQWLLHEELKALETLLREQGYDADPEDKENFKVRSRLVDNTVTTRNPHFQ